MTILRDRRRFPGERSNIRPLWIDRSQVVLFYPSPVFRRYIRFRVIVKSLPKIEGISSRTVCSGCSFGIGFSKERVEKEFDRVEDVKNEIRVAVGTKVR